MVHVGCGRMQEADVGSRPKYRRAEVLRHRVSDVFVFQLSSNPKVLVLYLCQCTKCSNDDVQFWRPNVGAECFVIARLFVATTADLPHVTSYEQK